MRYRLKDNGRHLIPIREIEFQILSDDPKAVRVFRNYLLNALTGGVIKPRNEFGFEVEISLLSRVTEDAIEEYAARIVRESKPRSITDFGINPTEAKKFAREFLDKDAKLNVKEFVLMGYLTKEDVTRFLAGHGIACEWVSSEPQSHSKFPAKALKVVINDTKQRRYPLDDAIDKAIIEFGFTTQTVWATLIDWASSTQNPFSDLIGFTEEGIQYRGTRYQKDGLYDILTRKQLGERIRKRRKKHSNPL